MCLYTYAAYLQKIFIMQQNNKLYFILPENHSNNVNIILKDIKIIALVTCCLRPLYPNMLNTNRNFSVLTSKQRKYSEKIDFLCEHKFHPVHMSVLLEAYNIKTILHRTKP